MPDAELTIVRKRVAKETSVIRRTGERDGLMLRFGIHDGINAVAEVTCSGIEIYTTEVISDRIELQTSLGKGTGSTEVE